MSRNSLLPVRTRPPPSPAPVAKQLHRSYRLTDQLLWKRSAAGGLGRAAQPQAVPRHHAAAAVGGELATGAGTARVRQQVCIPSANIQKRTAVEARAKGFNPAFVQFLQISLCLIWQESCMSLDEPRHVQSTWAVL